jgi:MoaA/NifB/PqqE/SkfB family radical SAM enzyme
VDRELTTEEWKKALREAWEIGIPHVTFTGGEPTIREDLLDLISYAESLGQVSGVLTNGTKFDDPEYVGQLELTGVDHFLISYDPTRPIHKVALQNALDSDVYTAVHISITENNQDSILSSLEELVGLGVPAISFGAASDDADLIQTMEEARAHAAYLGMHLIWDIAAPYSATNPIAVEVDEIGVGAGTAWMYIEPDGDVLPSQGIDRILGNVLKNSWEDILNSAAN